MSNITRMIGRQFGQVSPPKETNNSDDEFEEIKSTKENDKIQFFHINENHSPSARILSDDEDDKSPNIEIKKPIKAGIATLENSKSNLIAEDFEMMKFSDHEEKLFNIKQSLKKILGTASASSGVDIANMLGDIREYFKEVTGVEGYVNKHGMLELTYNDRFVTIAESWAGNGETLNLISDKLQPNNNVDKLVIILGGAILEEQKYKFNKNISHAMLLVKQPYMKQYVQLDPKSSVGRFFSAPNVIPELNSLISNHTITLGLQSAYTEDCMKHCFTMTILFLAHHLFTNVDSETNSIEDSVNTIIKNFGINETTSIKIAKGIAGIAARKIHDELFANTDEISLGIDFESGQETFMDKFGKVYFKDKNGTKFDTNTKKQLD